MTHVSSSLPIQSKVWLSIICISITRLTWCEQSEDRSAGLNQSGEAGGVTETGLGSVMFSMVCSELGGDSDVSSQSSVIASGL